ncbi:substrate-binding domain-containing protein [Caldicellulosiruptor changbaiensis]|uniref:substrate-binding domain-containing protein n=1 Tax=Caldicellulosiruptor changbaiensis TaxID=1222016 RepID=UPI0027D9A4D1|nr:substrate-binding domain-containing protein [Caldicellulosiruptor changbaiensis]
MWLFLLFNNLNKLIKGIEVEARENGYNIILGNFSDSQKIEEEYYKMMKGQIADGILLTGSLSEPQRIVELSRQFKMVVISDYFSDELVTVCVDNFKSAYDATMFLYKSGYRKIAKITGKIGALLSQDRLKGYKMALENLGLGANEKYIKYGDYKYESGYKLAKELLTMPEPPDAIFCSNDEMAIGACDAAKELGISIPDELGIMGFDDIELASMVTPKITTVHQPRYEMGRLAARLLIDILKGGVVSKGKYILDTSIIPRESTKNTNFTN